jgi:hypothetical protein
MEVILSDVFSESKDEVLFESSSTSDIRQFAESLVLKAPPEPSSCLCLDPLHIDFYKEHQFLLSITSHDAELISCSMWESDALVSDAEPLLKWFDERRIDGPRKEYERQKKETARFAKAVKRWQEEMPSSLKPYWSKMSESGSDAMLIDKKPLLAALSKEYPSPSARILALLGWYGSGMGPWSGYPAYEGVAEELLLTYSTPELLLAVETHSLNEKQTQGAARLFGGWTFNNRRPDDRCLLSADLKAKLLAAAIKSGEKDNVDRAQKAFRENQ